jgi:outer membrane protein
MMAVIEKYAKDNGYSVILDVSSQSTPVLYASSAIDITQDIIALYDKTPAPAPPAAPGALAPAPGGAKTTGAGPSAANSLPGK